MCMECHYYHCPPNCPGEETATYGDAVECACCGELIDSEEDYRMLDGNAICIDCIRGMKLYELFALCSVRSEEELYEILGFELPRYSSYEEE